MCPCHTDFLYDLEPCLPQGSVSEPASRALQLLVALFGMFTVLSDLGDFLEDRYITGPMAAHLREEYYAVKTRLRAFPHEFCTAPVLCLCISRAWRWIYVLQGLWVRAPLH